MKELNENISLNEQAIVLLDFAENYSFVCQDAVQGFHWDNTQVMLHPVVVYYKACNSSGESIVCSKSYCVVSDDRNHNAVEVHKFIQVVIGSLKLLLPNLKHIHYFSDGASQYKNHKLFYKTSPSQC